MSLPRRRLTLPTSLALSLLSGASLSACRGTRAASDVVTSIDAVVTDGCTTLNGCLGGPVELCAPDDGGQVLSCPQVANCTSAFTLDGGLIGTQCYGECVTSILPDGATQTGLC